MKYLCLYIVIAFMPYFGETQHRISSCQIKRFNLISGPIRNNVQLLTIQPTDPLYNPTVQVLLELQNAFLVYPVFFFYDDKDQNNAMATDEVTQANGPDGTVIFGKRLFNREFIKTTGGTTIPVIIAHEYGHIVDFKYGVLQNAGVKRTELFADYFAGLYMYLRVLRKESTDVEQCYNSFKSMGDTNFGDLDSHGSPQERFNALQSAYNKADEYLRRGVVMNLNMAIEEGKKYVMSIPSD